MKKNVITRSQLEHLPQLHRIVVEQKIKKGEWKLLEKNKEGLEWAHH